MYIIYEYAACVLAAVIGTAMLFTAYVMLLLLFEGSRMLVRTLRKLRVGPLPAARQSEGG